jgi:hypothetical protein
MQEECTQDGEAILERVIVLVSDHMGVKQEALGSNSDLADDARMYGLDADEFLEAYAEEFNVHMAGFDFNRHFDPEGGPFAELYNFLFERQLLTKTSLRVRDLVISAQAGRWIPPARDPTTLTASAVLCRTALQLLPILAIAAVGLLIYEAFR